jgi:D-glycero-alpha-D-manno-heptose-7-phosphate kinase
MPIRSRTPTRIDFAGGTTDLEAYSSREGGAVISAAIDRHAYCTLTRGAGTGIRIASQDLEQFVEANDIRELEFDGNLDLLKAAAKTLDLPTGLEISVRSDAPPGSGTGASASIGVAMLGLLDHLRGANPFQRRSRLSRFELAELACRLEQNLGIVGGKQDQYSAAIGGFNYMEFHGEGRVAIEPLDLSPAVICELEKHLVLCYSGESRLSGTTNTQMIQSYEAGDPAVCGALREVKRVAKDMHRALLAADLRWFGELLDEEWHARRLLAPGVVTPRLSELRDAALAGGAVSGKVCGAGGGGCMLFLSKPDHEGAVRKALQQAGGQIIDFSFDFRGLAVWETE